MKCKVDDCDRKISYKEANLCQKHYFRLRRTGSTELKPKSENAGRCKNKSGYVMVKDNDHPLVMKNGYVYEHRKVVFSKYCFDVPPCTLCSKKVTWDNLHIDHIDNVVDNNNENNLRVLCRACNVMRARLHLPSHERKGNHCIEFNGEKKTAQEWSRDPRVKVAGNTIVNRLKKGLSVEDALFMKKSTHIHTRPRSKKPAYGEFIGEKN